MKNYHYVILPEGESVCETDADNEEEALMNLGLDYYEGSVRFKILDVKINQP